MKNNKENKVITIILIVVIILLVGLVVFLGFQLKEQKDISEKSQNTVKQLEENTVSMQNNIDNLQGKIDNITNTLGINSSNNVTNQKTDKEIIEELFLDKIKSDNENNSEKLLDYRIDSIDVLTGSDRESLLTSLEENKTTEDIFALVKYSLKPEDVNNIMWTAGNGEVSGEWIINKSSCIRITNNNGTYKIISDGTGW